jgi:hypothetical protein
MGASRVNTVAFLYGTCEPPSGTDGGCAPPLSISSFPVCEQPRSLYERYSGGGAPLPYENTRVRGAPAAVFNEGASGSRLRLEVYAGDARVVIAGDDAELVKRAADRMLLRARARAAPCALGRSCPSRYQGPPTRTLDRIQSASRRRRFSVKA